MMVNCAKKSNKDFARMHQDLLEIGRGEGQAHAKHDHAEHDIDDYI